eukprot:6803-Pelagomonas_calceolata.AAC.1
MNRTLEDMLRHFVSPHQQDWDEHLAMVEFAINNSYQESTKTTPFLLNFFKDPLLLSVSKGMLRYPLPPPLWTKGFKTLKTPRSHWKLHVRGSKDMPMRKDGKSLSTLEMRFS